LETEFNQNGCVRHNRWSKRCSNLRDFVTGTTPRIILQTVCLEIAQTSLCAKFCGFNLDFFFVQNLKIYGGENKQKTINEQFCFDQELLGGRFQPTKKIFYILF
jgi:hypothetical protein